MQWCTPFRPRATACNPNRPSHALPFFVGLARFNMTGIQADEDQSFSGRGATKVRAAPKHYLAPVPLPALVLCLLYSSTRACVCCVIPRNPPASQLICIMWGVWHLSVQNPKGELPALCMRFVPMSRYIKADMYRYRFTKLGSEESKRGQVWTREVIGSFWGATSRDGLVSAIGRKS